MSKKDDAAEDVERLWLHSQTGLDNKRKYPIREFNAYAQAVRRYLDLTQDDPLFDKNVVCEINGLTDWLSLERKRVPDSVLMVAQRLECLTFLGYDAYFEGDEPLDCDGRPNGREAHISGPTHAGNNSEPLSVRIS